MERKRTMFDDYFFKKTYRKDIFCKMQKCIMLQESWILSKKINFLSQAKSMRGGIQSCYWYLRTMWWYIRNGKLPRNRWFPFFFAENHGFWTPENYDSLVIPKIDSSIVFDADSEFPNDFCVSVVFWDFFCGDPFLGTKTFICSEICAVCTSGNEK